MYFINISPNRDPTGAYSDIQTQGYTSADYRRWDSYNPLQYNFATMVKNAAYPNINANSFDEG